MTFNITQRIWTSLSSLRKREFRWLCLLLIFSTVIENIAVIALSIFATTLLSPAGVEMSWWFPHLSQFLPSYFNNSAYILLTTGLIAITVVAFKNTFGALTTTCQAAFATKIEIDLGEALLERLSGVNVAWFHTQDTSQITLIAQWRQYSFNYLTGIIQIGLNTMLSAALLGVLMYTSPAMSLLIILICGPIGFLLFSLFKHKMHSSAHEYGRCCAEINDLFFCLVQGAKETRLFNAFPLLHSLFSKQGHKSISARSKQYLFTYLPTASFELVTLAALVFSTFLLASGATGDMEPHKLTEKITLLGATAWRLLPAINRLIGALSSLKASQPYVETFFELYDSAPSQHFSLMTSHEISKMPFENEISFSSLGFSYDPEQPLIIKDINTTIALGQSVGIIGESGAGKSTFANLLLGIYTPTTGQISIDGNTLTSENCSQWMANVGYVPQDPFLQNASLAENIAYGVPQNLIEEERVIECCRMAAIDFIPLTNEALQKPIGERGAMFSGGQRQRIAIARALYRRPKVILFDEATSALDDNSESTVIETVYKLKEDITLIMIAHRLTTLKKCDKILVLQNGKIVNEGAPDRILPLYKNSLLEGKHCE